MSNSNTLHRLHTTLDNLEKETETLSQTSKAYQKIEQLIQGNEDLTFSFQQIENQYRRNEVERDQFLQKILKQQTKFETHVQDLLVSYKRENRTNYGDLERLFRTRLEDSKLEIKQLIEAERNHNRAMLEDSFEKQTKIIELQQQSLSYTIWVVGGVLICLNLILGGLILWS